MNKTSCEERYSKFISDWLEILDAEFTSDFEYFEPGNIDRAIYSIEYYTIKAKERCGNEQSN